MRINEVMGWTRASRRRWDVCATLGVLGQPMTARQLSGKTGLSRDACSYVLWELSVYGVVRCVNPGARRSRLYGLTRRGQSCARRMGARPSDAIPSDLDWVRYGDLLFRHRTLVVRAMAGVGAAGGMGGEGVQSCEIKRRIRLLYPEARISANNVRDVIRYLKQVGVVEAVGSSIGSRPRYRLTSVGRVYRDLLLRAEAGR